MKAGTTFIAISVSLAAWTSAGCKARTAASRPTVTVSIEIPAGVAVGDLQVTPSQDVVARHPARDGRTVELELDARTETFRLSAPGACPITVTPKAQPPARVSLAPVVSLPRDMPQVGWDADAKVVVTPHCDEARQGHIEWRELEGHLPRMDASPDGFELTLRTERFIPEGPLPWGIVPLSPRTRGAHLLEATWMPDVRAANVPHVPGLKRTILVAAMARANGVTSITKGQDVLIAGDGWHLARSNPKDARVVLEPFGPSLVRFRADSAGQFVLVDGKGLPLAVRANTHERVPLDCGRGECHAATTLAAQSSKMTHVLKNAFEGTLGIEDVPCAAACHAVGEPGLDDDGFVSMRHALGVQLPSPHPGAWDELPRALRRLGGVGCTTCHGPAAIPEPTTRFAILRTDVCATCHDAPPRYAHVARWRSSAMAHADRDREAATDVACQRCHTTAGFLRTLSAAPREDAPASVGPVGIACAACHAPHQAGAHASLIRDVKVGRPFEGLEPASRVCVPCHEGDAARVWSGRSAAAVKGAPHASLGCAGCHVEKRSEATAQRGASHDFRASRAKCESCHTSTLVDDGAALGARARSALEALTRARVAIAGTATPASVSAPEATRPPHARRVSAADPADRVLVDDLVSVIDDRGSWVHNAPFARATVTRAEARIAGPR